jgi:hypothetical protein
MKYEISRIKAKIILKTTLPLYQQLSLSSKKDSYKYVQTNPIDSLALIVTKDSYRQFSFQNQRPEERL